MLVALMATIYSVIQSEGAECLSAPTQYSMSKIVGDADYSCSCDVVSGPTRERIHFDKTSFWWEEPEIPPFNYSLTTGV